MKNLGTPDDPYDVIGLGFGPSNIALAIAAQEIAPDRGCLFLERSPDTRWHPAMLVDGSRMQISFLKDLVSLRNLASPFTFLAYTKAKGRLEKFVNLSEFRPTRLEFEDYLRWVAEQFSDVVCHHTEVTSVTPVREEGELSLFRVTATDTATGAIVEYHTRNVVHALGGLPRLPDGVTPGPNLLHSSAFLTTFPPAFTDPDRAWEFAVAGDGQSAGEITTYMLDRYRNARVHLILPGYSLRATDNNPFANEQFFEANADDFYSRSQANRRDYAASLRTTNYGVVEAGALDVLYRLVYADEVRGRTRLVVHDGSRLVRARSEDGVVRIGIDSRFGAGSSTLEVDGLVLATGYRRELDPAMYSAVLPYLDTDDDGWPVVSREHRVRTTEELTAGLYVQGFAEATHGLGDTLLSLLPFRSKQIITAIAKDGGMWARNGAVPGAEQPAAPPDERDVAALARLVEGCDAGTLVTAGADGYPAVTRVPFVLARADGRHGMLCGVLDRADVRRSAWDGVKVLAVFPAGAPDSAASVEVRGCARLVDLDGGRTRIEIEIEAFSGPLPAPAESDDHDGGEERAESRAAPTETGRQS
ncbi:MAG TPA: SidA/IucD/PvdA family monooxygenase [Streptosporangiaceae bacterium]|nr:SidA/IucD/PvdA family monooxygenase [Streptosporangiaceae bacterium]